MINYSLKELFRDKKNLLNIIIIVVCLLITILGTEVYLNFKKYTNELLNNNIGFRTISINNTNDLDENTKNNLENISHVVKLISSKYASVTLQTQMFSSFGYDGYTDILLGGSNISPEVTIGNELENKSGEIICPVDFYPNSNSDFAAMKKTSIEIKTGDVIDFNYNTYKLNDKKTSYELDQKLNKSFTVVGLYDRSLTNNQANECYGSYADIKEIQDITMPHQDNITYGYNLIIDNYKNIDNVVNDLSTMGYNRISLSNTLDLETINKIEIGSLIISLVSTFTAILIIFIILYKEYIKKYKNIGVKIAIGYSKKEIYIFELIKYTAFITLSMIIVILIYYLIKKFVLANYIFNLSNIGFNIKIYYSIFLIIYIIIIIITAIYQYILIHKIFNSEIEYYLSEGE